ncbi:MAG: DUF58 domain-containing protein, partial [Planctomycetota bacterium]
KRELVAELGATLAFSAIKNNDKIGLVCFTDHVEKFVGPRKGSGHVLRVIRELLAFAPTGRGTDIADALDHVNRMMRKRAVMFVISDFQDTGYERALRIARRRHDVILVRVTDRREQTVPRAGLVELTDNETGRRIVIDTSSAGWRAAYQRHAREAAEQQDRRLRQIKLDSIEVRTGESFVDPLVRFFRTREARL